LLEDVEMKLQTWAGKYIRTFELFDKSARIDLIQAYQQGEWTGLLDGVPASVSRSGWSDTLLRLAVNLHGAPPLSGKEFAAYRSGKKADTIVGMGLVVRLPTGESLPGPFCFRDLQNITRNMNHIACCPLWPDHAEFRSRCDKSVTRNRSRDEPL
jgi:hypothetical protein